MLRTIAYAAEEPVLLTFEDALLLAFDAVDGTLRWRLELPRPVAAVVFGAPNALGLASSTSPWRSGLSGSTAIAVDVDGGIHVVDAVTGALARSEAGVGAPLDIASAVDVFAIATKDRVVVWRDGARSEHAIRATAVAFSHDGTSLAIGTKAGGITTVTGEDRKERLLGVTIYALAWHPRFGWLAGTERGLYADNLDLHVFEGRIRTLAIDRQGARVAFPRGDQSVQVVAWPKGASLPTRITVRGRGVQDVAFGPNDLLAVGLNRGDVSLVDLGKRTSKPASREIAAWKTKVELELPPKPPESPEPTKKWGKGIGGIGALALGARALFIVIRASSTHSYAPPPPDFSAMLRCDSGCETTRLNDLARACLAAGANCAQESRAALDAFNEGDCAGARKAVASIELEQISQSPPNSSAYGATLLARNGLITACVGKTFVPDGLTRITGSALGLTPEHVDLPTTASEQPFDVLEEPDGTTFVTTVDHETKTCRSYHSVDGVFQADSTINNCVSAQIFDRGTGAYIAMGTWIGHLVGGEWQTAGTVAEGALGITGAAEAGGDLWVTTGENHLLRYHDYKWAPVALPEKGLILGTIAYSVDTLIVGASAQDGGARLLRRGKDAKWLTTKGTVASEPIFAAPNGLVVVGHAKEFDSSTDEGTTWNVQGNLPFAVDAIWARTWSEVYAGGAHGILQLSRGAWARTSFTAPVIALSGNEHEMVAIVQRAP